MPLNDEQYSNCSSLLEYYGNHWGWVYAREAVPSSIAFGFQQLHLAELVAFTAIANLRSRAVMRPLRVRSTLSSTILISPANPDCAGTSYFDSVQLRSLLDLNTSVLSSVPILLHSARDGEPQRCIF